MLDICFGTWYLASILGTVAPAIIIVSIGILAVKAKGRFFSKTAVPVVKGLLKKKADPDLDLKEDRTEMKDPSVGE